METKEYRLTDICDFQGGTQPPKEEWINEPRDGYVRMLQIRDFTQGKEEHIAYVKDTKKLNKCEEDDILIGRYGASVGKILTGLAGAYNVAIIKTIPNKELLSKRYLYYVLTGTDFQNFILNIGARAAQAGFNKSDLSLFKLHIPTSLDDQERIADVLERTKNLFGKREKSIDLLDEFLKMKFLEMFGDPSINNMKWKVLPFGKIAKNENKKRVPLKQSDRDLRHGPFPYYGATGEIDSIDDYKFDGVYLLIAEDGKNLLFRKKNNAFMVEGKFWVNNHAHVLSFNGQANLKYLEYVINFLDLKPYVTGIDQFKLNKENLDKIPIPIPPIDDQDKFEEIVNQTNKVLTLFKNHLLEITDLNNSLSQKAFKGELQIIEKVVLEGTIKVEPKISGEVIVINKINEELEEFHKRPPHSGAPAEIDNTIRQLEAELKIKGEIPFWDEYVKYRIVKGKFKEPFTFDQLWEEIAEFPFETVPEYDEISSLLFKWLAEENAFIRQQFNPSTRQIELIVNETAKA